MFFEVGVYQPKYKKNIGTLLRSAYQLGADGCFTIGRRYKRQRTDTYNTGKQIPIRTYESFDVFLSHIPAGAFLIGVEMGGKPLSKFVHPKRAIYLLGAEDYGLPEEIIEQCAMIVSLECVTQPSYNLAVAASIIMYDRVFGKGE